MTDSLLNSCWPSPAQLFLVPSPGGLMTICYCVTILGVVQRRSACRVRNQFGYIGCDKGGHSDLGEGKTRLVPANRKSYRQNGPLLSHNTEFLSEVWNGFGTKDGPFHGPYRREGRSKKSAFLFRRLAQKGVIRTNNYFWHKRKTIPWVDTILETCQYNLTDTQHYMLQPVRSGNMFLWNIMYYSS
jgi:hypothetical protein